MVPQSVLTTTITDKAGQSAPSNCDVWEMEPDVPLFSAAPRGRKGRTESALTLSRGARHAKLKQLLSVDWEYSLVMECLPSVRKP